MKMKKSLALLALSSLTLLAGCGGNTSSAPASDTSSTEETSVVDSSVAASSTEDESCSGEFATYTLTFQSTLGVGFKKKKVTLTCEEDGITEEGTTNNNGVVVFKEIFAHNYKVTIDGVSDEYKMPDDMSLSGSVKFKKANADGVYNFSKTFEGEPVILDTKLAAGSTYSVGDVIHDFTFTDCNGETYKVSDILKKYDCIFLDLFYINCTYCLKEYDALVDLHEEYATDVFFMGVSGFAPDYGDAYYEAYEEQIREAYDSNKDYYSQYWSTADDMIAYYVDTDERLQQATDDYNLNYPVGKDPVVTEAKDKDSYGDTLSTALQCTGFPTAFMIDRYGYITWTHTGWVTSDYKTTDKQTFRDVFDTYCGADYTPTLY